MSAPPMATKPATRKDADLPRMKVECVTSAMVAAVLGRHEGAEDGGAEWSAAHLPALNPAQLAEV